jgi:squalene synthase HpnC
MDPSVADPGPVMNLKEALERWGPEANAPCPTLAESEHYCRQLAQSHYENFTVVSWLFPRHMRQHLCNVYAYCRWADDLADEASSAPESLRLLDWWAEQLENPTPRHPVFVALRKTIREKKIPLQPFRDLLVAFRQDQTQTRYETWEELQGYCQHSANPVGRMVLYLGSSATPENEAWSDSICTGLQLINFCQDVRRDYERGRIYLPRTERVHWGWDDATFAGLMRTNLGERAPAFREMLREQVARAEGLLRAGEPLVRHVHRDLQLPVRLFISGGLAIATAIRQQHYDVWSRRPVVTRWKKLVLLAQAWLGSKAPRGKG